MSIERAEEAELVGERYRLVRELGSGGMGRVFAARDCALARDVAVKRMHERLADPDSVARFEREARTAGSLSHPNIVTVFDIGWESGRPYLVSELLEGVTLKELFEKGPIPESQIAAIALQLARGLAAAHARGIVHRDLKPANIFITAAGQLKLLDFGIAKLLRGEENTGASGAVPSTDLGRVMGTVGYMAPEQVRGQPVTPLSDVFSFGVVLHELLSGRRLYQRGSSVETGYAIISEEAPILPAAVSPGLERLTRACLRKKAEERPSASQLAAQLEELSGATPVANETPLTTRALAPRSSRRLAALVLAVFALGGLLAAAGLKLGATLRENPRLVAGALPGPVAVLPFTVQGEAAEEYLGEGAIDLLGGAFASDGLRTVAPRRIVRELARGGEARAIAQRAGATAYVTGTIAVEGSRLHVAAELRDPSDGSIHQRASVDGDTARPLEALMRLAAQLASGLRGVGEGAVAPSRIATVASVSTQSAPALADWLKGEALLRRNDWVGAREAFRRATTRDPGFALAQYRLAVTSALREPGLAADALQSALVSRQTLSPHDRALVEAFADFSQGRAGRAEAEYRAIIADNPDDVEALFQLGEVLFHWNPLRGRLAAEAEPVFNRVLVLDPENGPALTHLIDLAQASGQKGLTLALADRFLALEEERDASSLLPIEWARSWAAGSASQRAEVLAALRSAPASVIHDAFLLAIWQGDDLVAAHQIAQLLVEDGTEPLRRSYGLVFLAILDLAGGRPGAARVKLAQAETLTPDPAMTYYTLWLESDPRFPVSAERLRAAREKARAWDLSRSPNFVPWRAHVAGMLALRAGDLEEVGREVALLNSLPKADDSLASDLALELEAELALAGGRDDEAAQKLEAMQLRIPYRFVSFFAHAVPRRLRAQLLSSQGRLADARKQLQLADFGVLLAPVSFAPDALFASELLEKSGDVPGAIEQLQRFVSLWGDCEPALKPRVDDARAHLRQLAGAAPGSSLRDTR